MKKKLLLLSIILTVSTAIILTVVFWIYHVNNEIQQKKARLECSIQMNKLAKAIDQYVLKYGNLPKVKNTEELGDILKNEFGNEKISLPFLLSLKINPDFSSKKWKSGKNIPLLFCHKEKHNRVMHILYSNGNDDFILSERPL